MTLQEYQSDTPRKGPPDRICSHRQRITHVEWIEGVSELGARLAKNESVSSVVYYAYPFRGICSDCGYLVFSRGPESVRNT